MEQTESAPPAGAARAGNARQVRLVLVGALFLVPAILGLFFAYALIGIFILAGLAGAWMSLRQARELADTPTSKIRSAAQGRVEIVARGRAVDEDGQPILAPLTDSPCCYWQLDAQRRIKRDKDSEEWQTEAFVRSVPELLPLEDGTGTCLVLIAEAELEAGLREDRPATPDLLNALAGRFPAHQRASLAKPGPWRLVQISLPADRDLYVMGRFQSYSSSALPYDDSWEDRMAGADEGLPVGLRRMAQLTLGKVAPPRAYAVARWQAAMRRLEGIAPGAPLQGTAMAHVMAPDRRPGNSQRLIVSATPERGLMRRYRFQAAGGVAIALVATAVLLFVLADTHPEAAQALLHAFGIHDTAPPAATRSKD
ncbi:MAG: hypothetical protein RIB84_23080 [Sneathiellaceae bacterium]